MTPSTDHDPVAIDTPSTEAAPASDVPALFDAQFGTANELLLTISDEEPLAEGEEWEAEPDDDGTDESNAMGLVEAGSRPPRVRRRRRVRTDSPEIRLQGRRAMCKRIADIAPRMLKQVKLRILTSYLDAKRLSFGREDEDLTAFILSEAAKLADRKRVLDALTAPGPDCARAELQAVLFAVLLQEELYAAQEQRLYEKVIDFEKAIVKRSKSLDLTELRRSDPDRWHHFDTYRIVLEAAWSNDNLISPDESRLLGVLRSHLGITQEDHWLISALLKRFPKDKCVLHTPDEVNDARKDLQRQGLLWNYKDDDDQNIDVIPSEIAAVIRAEHAGQELQLVNYRRLVAHDGILLAELRSVLQRHGLDRSGNKAELVERVVQSGIKPSQVLDELDKEKLVALCAGFGLKSSGTKAELSARLIDFYDDLTFEERVTKDAREVWYANFELLARRSYAELRAKKLIAKDLDIQTLFEDATAFLFDVRLRVPCDMSRKEHKADGRLQLENGECLLLDCKSAEAAVNLQDHLEGQFDAYLRKEREGGKTPLGFLVIGPAFTPQSLKLANQYKARTNWDVALVTAEGLRHLADRWVAAEPEKAFPVRLLNRTEVIDKDRAEFLLSLV